MQTVQQLRKVCVDIATQMNSTTDHAAALQTASSKLETLYFDKKPTQVWYLLEVAYSLLMPAHAAMVDDIWEFQVLSVYLNTKFVQQYSCKIQYYESKKLPKNMTSQCSAQRLNHSIYFVSAEQI